MFSFYFKLEHFGRKEDQFKVFYLLLNAKSYPAAKLLSLFNSTGNESVASVFEEEEMTSSDRNEEAVEENEEWILLRKVITDNIDRLSSHTMNLGLVLCFASGIGLITGKDREIIVRFLQKITLMKLNTMQFVVLEFHITLLHRAIVLIDFFSF